MPVGGRGWRVRDGDIIHVLHYFWEQQGGHRIMKSKKKNTIQNTL